MTREEFMDIVYSELYSDGDNYRANRIIDAADEYAEDSSSEKPNKWIPVSKGLPKPYNDVYLTICANSAYYGFNKNFMKVKCGQYQPQDDKRDWLVDGVRYYFDNVIAWMSYQVPEPYRADREEVSDEEEEDDCTDIYCENCRNNYNCIEYLEEQERMNEEDDE